MLQTLKGRMEIRPFLFTRFEKISGVRGLMQEQKYNTFHVSSYCKKKNLASLIKNMCSYEQIVHRVDVIIS